MSNTFGITVTRIDGDTVELQASPTWSMGLNAHCRTRSFALMALNDGTPAGSPLDAAIRATDGTIYDPNWHKKHVKRFIKKIWLVAMDAPLDEAAFQAMRHELDDQLSSADVTVAAAAEKRLLERFPRHRFTLRVQVVDPSHLEGLTAGSAWASSAFDVWPQDTAKMGIDCVLDEKTGARVPKKKRA